MESIDYILKMFNLLNLLKYTKNNFLKSSRVERIGYLYILYMISKSIEAITTMKKKDIKSNIFFYIKGLSFIKDKINQEKSGRYPATYLGYPLKVILDEINCSQDEFDNICDKFTNKNLFQCNNKGQLIKDETGSLILKNRDYE